MPAASGTADRSAHQSPPRFYFFRVLHIGPTLVSVEPTGPHTDLVAAWEAALYLRKREPEAVFIAGEMSSTADLELWPP